MNFSSFPEQQMITYPTRQPWIALGEHLDPWGDPLLIGQPMADFTVHSCVVGTTGSGKSTLLRGIAQQFFELGGTVIVIEPHGDLILSPQEGLLAALPPDQLDRVVLLDFAGDDPPQMNLLANQLDLKRSVLVDMAMSCIRVMEEASWEGGARLRQILRHALHLLIEVHGQQASMLELNRLLEERGRVETLLREIEFRHEIGESRAYLKRFLRELDANRRTTYDEVMQFPLRRAEQFLLDETLRHTVALPALSPTRALNLARLMNSPEPSLILVPLQATQLGTEAKRVLGTLLLQNIATIFLARAALPAEARRPTMVMVDEFADLAGSEAGTIIKGLLAQARKFGASVVLATQSLAQVPPDVRQELRSNCNIKIVLRPADMGDARAAVQELGSDLLGPHDLFGIERYCGYARVVVDRVPQPPCYFRALPPASLQPGHGRVYPSPGQPPPAHAYLAELHRLAEEEAREDRNRVSRRVVDRLVTLSDAEFRALVRAQEEASRWEAAQLLAHPALDADPVRRAWRVSRARYGFPRWFYEAQYRRLRFGRPTITR